MKDDGTREFRQVGQAWYHTQIDPDGSDLRGWIRFTDADRMVVFVGDVKICQVDTMKVLGAEYAVGFVADAVKRHTTKEGGGS